MNHNNTTTTIQQLKKELANKQSLLRNKSIIDKLPDKGERIKLQIAKIEKQLEELDHAAANQQTTTQVKQELSVKQREKQPLRSDGEVDALASLLTQTTISPSEEREHVKRQRMNFLLQQGNGFENKKSMEELESQMKQIYGTRGEHLFNQKRIEVISLDECAAMERKRRELALAQLLSSEMNNNVMNDDEVEDQENEMDPDDQREVIDYDDVDD